MSKRPIPRKVKRKKPPPVPVSLVKQPKPSDPVVVRLSVEDEFIHNAVAFLAEERLALGVRFPTSFVRMKNL